MKRTHRWRTPAPNICIEASPRRQSGVFFLLLSADEPSVALAKVTNSEARCIIFLLSHLLVYDCFDLLFRRDGGDGRKYMLNAVQKLGSAVQGSLFWLL
ncbi:hypothetical protein DL98DRAFT_516655, partial [Cadophora sp. DSE1049]